MVYLQLNADGGLLAGGLRSPAVNQLDPLRQSMIDNPEKFKLVIAALEQSGRSLDMTDSVKTMPRGYNEHTKHPLAAFLRLKQLVVIQQLSMEELIDGAIVKRVAAFAKEVTPLLLHIRDRAARQP